MATTARERVMLMTIKWLFDKLLAYMSGSGSTEEEDAMMAQIRVKIKLWDRLS